MFRSTETPCFAFSKGKIVPVGHNFKEQQWKIIHQKPEDDRPKTG